MADYWEGRERAWWEVSDFVEEVICKEIKNYKEQEVEEHGGQHGFFFFFYRSICKYFLISGFLIRLSYYLYGHFLKNNGSNLSICQDGHFLSLKRNMRSYSVEKSICHIFKWKNQMGNGRTKAIT